MIKRTVFSTLGVGLMGMCMAFAVRPAAADAVVQSSSSGATTTYFGSSPAATPPATEQKAEPAQQAPAQAPAPDTSATATPAAPATPTAETPVQATTQPPTVKAPEVATPAPPTVKAPDVATPATPAPPPVNPVVEAVRAKLADKSFLGKQNNGDDVAAAAEYYGKHTAPLWVEDGAYTKKAKAVISELRKADDWGLDSKDFVVSDLASGAAVDAQGAAEAQLTLSALKYARYARGGRLVPIQLSNILDMQPPVKDPKVVMAELADAAHPAAYLRGLNPHHEGFEHLRQALLKARGSKDEEEPVDPALLIKIPNGKMLRPGAVNDQVLLLRKRLKVVAENSEDDRRYDDALVDAVRSFQKEHGLRANGYLNNSTRAALNKAGEPSKVQPGRNVDRLIANMERWRWLPADLGHFYVMNNIPEFTSEIWKGNQIVLKQKMVDGQPSWPTPVLTASMKYVIFQPNWGMPNGIKVKELLPRLQRASSNGSGFGFFDQLFNGGESGGARVLEAYDLNVSLNGRPVDANSINWNNVDIRRFDFIQPPGPKNPLGKVKFRFPNRHDVYMHDTPERSLFGQSFRALSHGCMRVEEPRKTAEVILAEDKGWPAEKVDQLYQYSNTVALDKPVPVYLVYFTARVDANGNMQTYPDIYGNDQRVLSALRGHPVRYVAPQDVDPAEAMDRISDAGADTLSDAPPAARRPSAQTRQASRAQKRQARNANDIITNALGGMFLN